MRKQDTTSGVKEENKSGDGMVGGGLGAWLDAKLTTVGWFLLLWCGLAFMLPEQMKPLLQWSVLGVTLQMLVGVAAALVALNFLLKD